MKYLADVLDMTGSIGLALIGLGLLTVLGFVIAAVLGDFLSWVRWKMRKKGKPE